MHNHVIISLFICPSENMLNKKISVEATFGSDRHFLMGRFPLGLSSAPFCWTSSKRKLCELRLCGVRNLLLTRQKWPLWYHNLWWHIYLLNKLIRLPSVSKFPHYNKTCLISWIPGHETKILDGDFHRIKYSQWTKVTDLYVEFLECLEGSTSWETSNYISEELFSNLSKYSS